MTYALIADPHMGNHKRFGGEVRRGINRRAELCFDVLSRAVELTQARCAELIVAGDLIDSAGPVPPQLAHRLTRVLPEEALLVVGNHDATSAEDHSLGLYAEECRIASRTCHRAGLVGTPPQVTLVPYTESLPRTAAPLTVGHFGIYDDSFPDYLRKSHTAKHVNDLLAWMRESGVRVLACGDWHSRRVWHRHTDGYIWQTAREGETVLCANEQVIMQIGALCPTGWDNPGLHGYGTLAFWDGERLEWQELPGPRFCVARNAEEERALVEEAAKLGHRLFLRRYYVGDKPETPSGLEAYEALPIQIEKAAQVALAAPVQAVQLQTLVSEWLDQFDNDERAIREEMARRYL